ncbi:MAG: hypothetical protein ACK6DC_21825 [Planctomycetota bacterium]|jgi:hypothetical protein
MYKYSVEDLNLPFTLRHDPAKLAQQFPLMYVSRNAFHEYPSATGPIEGNLGCAISILGSTHFGVPVSLNISEMLNDCANAAVELFFGDWYLHERDPVTFVPAPWTKEDAYHSCLKHGWFVPFKNALILCMLGKHWKETQKICSWVHSDLDMGYQGDLEPEVGQIIITMAAQVAGNNEVDLASLATEVSKTRKKRPKLLFDLLKAVCERDQEAFDTALTASLKHFARRKPNQWEMCYDWIAWYPSTFCLYGNHLGLKTPDLPRNLAIRLITRQSVGLE